MLSLSVNLSIFSFKVFCKVTLKNILKADLDYSTLWRLSVRRNGSTTWLGGPPPSSHTAQHVNGRGVQRSEIIAEEGTGDTTGTLHKDMQTQSADWPVAVLQLTKVLFTCTRELFYLLNVSKTRESSECLASLCPGGRHRAPISIS